jgi:hypothetical protein
MSGTVNSCRVVVLVKALPQPSKAYGETVCCAGVTADRQWKRLFPIRFRHLTGDGSFSRWDWVRFDYRRPTRDPRKESCHIHEETIAIDGKPLTEKERVRLLTPMIVASSDAATARGDSLAIIRPKNTRFHYKPKKQTQIQKERDAYKRAASQTSMFDKDLAELDPSTYEFRFTFEDRSGKHDYQCGDWETHAMFWRWKRHKGETEALELMAGTFNDEYPQKGIVFAIGNQAKRPHIWQLLGVIRLGESDQGELL